jgi:hypothetical protein
MVGADGGHIDQRGPWSDVGADAVVAEQHPRQRRGVASMVITAWASRAAAAGVAAIAALPLNAPALERVRFHTVTWWPAG